MNRRSFFRLLGGAALAAALPLPKLKPAPVTGYRFVEVPNPPRYELVDGRYVQRRCDMIAKHTNDAWRNAYREEYLSLSAA